MSLSLSIKTSVKQDSSTERRKITKTQLKETGLADTRPVIPTPAPLRSLTQEYQSQNAHNLSQLDWYHFAVSQVSTQEWRQQVFTFPSQTGAF